jgi:hypothetical protein
MVQMFKIINGLDDMDRECFFTHVAVWRIIVVIISNYSKNFVGQSWGKIHFVSE